jgi:WD40 repeat protein/predicted Ser/Thr protein kinase
MQEQHSDQELSEKVQQLGLIAPADLQECLEIQKKFREFGKEMRLSDLLVKKKYLTQQQLDSLWQTTPSKTPTVTALSGRQPRANVTRRFSRYQVVCELGRGGMGVVYEAFDPHLSRNVALKVLSEVQASDKEQQRFVREAHLMAKLEHPNIIKVYDVGHEQGKLFFTMERVHGQNLDKLLGENMPLPQLIHLLVKVTHAVHYAHQQGVIHRDLKPSNIMVTAEYEPKVMDFGLAKEIDKATQKMSQSADIIGTPKYMSPEQAAGKLKEVDARSDVYALGVILYQMLTGHMPFTADNTVNLLYQIMFIEPPPPSRYFRRISRDIEAVCLKAMEKDKTRRYQSANELALDLTRYLEGQSVTAKPMTTAVKLDKWVRRHRVIALASGVFLCLLLAVVSYFVYQLQQRAAEESKLRRLAEQKTLLATQKEAEARQYAIGSKLSQAEAELMLARTYIDNQNFVYACERQNKADSLLQSALLILRELAVASKTKADASSDMSPLFTQHRLLSEASADMWRYCLSYNITGTQKTTLADMPIKFTKPQHLVIEIAQPSILLPWLEPPAQFIGLWQSDQLRLWNLQERQSSYTISGSGNWLAGTQAISDTNVSLAAATSDGEIVLWQPGDNKIVKKAVPDKPEIVGMRFSPDRQWLFIVSASALHIWQVSPLQPLHTINCKGRAKNSVGVFSQNSKWLVVRGTNEIITAIFDMSEFAKKIANPAYKPMPSRSFSGHAKTICFGPQDRTIISADENDIRITPMVQNANEGGEEGTITLLAAHRGKICDLTLRQDGNYFASLGQDGRLAVWSSYSYRKLWEAPFSGRIGDFPRARFRSQQPFIGVWNSDTLNLYAWQTNLVKKLDVVLRKETQKTYQTLFNTLGHTSWARNQGNAVVGVVLSPDSRYLACYLLPNLYLWDTQEDTITRLQSHFVEDRLQVSFSGDGTLLMSRGQEQVFVWRIADKQQLLSAPTSDKNYWWHPAANLIVSAPRSASLQIEFNQLINNKLVLQKNIQCAQLVNDCVFSPDTGKMAVLMRNGLVDIWDVGTATPQRLYSQQMPLQGSINTACFSEIHCIALANSNGDFMLYDWHNRKIWHQIHLYNPIRRLWYDAHDKIYWIQTQDTLFVYRHPDEETLAGKLDSIYPLPVLSGYPFMALDMAGDFRHIAAVSQSGEILVFAVPHRVQQEHK